MHVICLLEVKVDNNIKISCGGKKGYILFHLMNTRNNSVFRYSSFYWRRTSEGIFLEKYFSEVGLSKTTEGPENWSAKKYNAPDNMSNKFINITRSYSVVGPLEVIEKQGEDEFDRP